MNNLSILFLGWDFLPNNFKEPETNCYGVVKAMANQVNLSLILPKADTDFILNNVNLTGLNNVNFKAITADRALPKAQPFAEANYIRSEIPLYGSANVPENQRSYSEEKFKISVTFAQQSPAINKTNHAAQDTIEYFDQVDWENLRIDAKVIHYARFATRFAITTSFDVIFASNWLTYLAGNELHLITGKPLAIQMNTLCQDHRDLNKQGWRYELEKMVIERANYIFTSNPAIAESIKAAYPLSADKVIYFDETQPVNGINFKNSPQSKSDSDTKDYELFDSVPVNHDFESQSDKIIQVILQKDDFVNEKAESLSLV